MNEKPRRGTRERLETSTESTNTSNVHEGRAIPRSLELSIIGLALVIDEIINLARLAGTNFSSLSTLGFQNSAIIGGFLIAGIAMVGLGVVWRPPKPSKGDINLGIKALSIYSGVSFFAFTVWLTIPLFSAQQDINKFLAVMLLIIFASIFYVLAKSLWSTSNAARITATIFYLLLILLTLASSSPTLVVPALLTPAAIIWYMFGTYVKNLYSPPPPPEAGSYVLRTRVEAIKCPHCGAENSPSAKSCEKCGTPLVSLTEAGAKPIAHVPSLMIPIEEELKNVEAKLGELMEFRKSHTVLNPESYDNLIEMQKRRLEELRSIVPGQSSRKQGRT